MPPSIPRVLLTLAVSGPPTVGLLLYVYLRKSYVGNAIWTMRASPLHARGYAMSVANPRHFAIEGDSLTLRIPLRRLKVDISDEEILARFTRGFFGGWAFTPERQVFAVSGRRFTKFSALDAIPLSGTPSMPPTIWSLNSLSRVSVPPLGSLLFNNFLLLDCSSIPPSTRAALLPERVDFPRPSHAFAEFAFGSDKSSFSGSQRFEVQRERDDKGDLVVVRFSSIRCNPSTDGAFVAPWLVAFHEIYAKVLFSDGIREIMKR